LKDDGAAAGSEHLHCHLALANEVELVGLFALSEDNLSGVETHIGCTSDKQLKIRLFQPLKEGVL
jgi:hypothetical protein